MSSRPSPHSPSCSRSPGTRIWIPTCIRWCSKHWDGIVPGADCRHPKKSLLSVASAPCQASLLVSPRWREITSWLSWEGWKEEYSKASPGEAEKQSCRHSGQQSVYQQPAAGSSSRWLRTEQLNWRNANIVECQAGMVKCRNVSPEPTFLALGCCAHAVLGNAPSQTPVHRSTASLFLGGERTHVSE